MKKVIHIVVSFFILTMLTNCSSVSSYYRKGYEKTEIITLKIDTIKKDYQAKIDQNQVNIEKKYEEVIAKQNRNSQDANLFVYGIINLSGMKTPKTRLDTLIEFKARSAFSLLVTPTPDQLIKENDEIRKELDETKISLYDLQLKYSQIEQENNKKREEIDLAKSELAKIKEERNQLEKEKSEKIIELQELRNKISQDQSAQAAEREKIAKDNKEMKAKIAYGAAGLGAILIIIGIVVLKSPLMAILGGGFIGFSVFIATAPTWVLWTVPSVLIIAGGVLVYLKYHKEKILNEGNIKAIQRFKESAKDVYEQDFKPLLLNEHGKYNKDGTVVEDKSKTKEIDKRLMDLGLK
jgi:hypothetical protein